LSVVYSCYFYSIAWNIFNNNRAVKNYEGAQ